MGIRTGANFAHTFTPLALPTQWQHVATVTAPIGTHITKCFKAVRNSVVDLRFIGIVLCIGLGDAFRDHKWIALLMAKVMAVRALHASRVFEELPT